MSWLGARDTDQFEALEVKANAVMELVCSWDKTLSITDAKKHQDNYLQGFSDATVIEAMTYAGRSTWMGFGPGLGLVSAPMKKCADSACVRDELNDLLFALSVDLQSVSATSGSKFTRLRL